MTTNLDTLRAQPLTLIAPATQALADGGSIGAWRKAMEIAIKRSQTASYIAGIAERLGVSPGLVKKPSRAERKELDARIAAQLKYLDGFVADLRAGKLTMPQAQARANLYSGATRGTFYATRYPALNNVPGDGKTRCNGNCQCYLEEDGNKVYWRLTAKESCPDCIELAAGSPYQSETETTKEQSDQEKAMFARMGGGGGGGGGKNTLWPVGPDGKRHDPSKGGGGGGSSTSAGGDTAEQTATHEGHSQAAHDAHAKMLNAEDEINKQQEPLREKRRKIWDEREALYEQRGELQIKRENMDGATAAEKAKVTKEINAIDKQLAAKHQESEALLKETLAVEDNYAHNVLKVDNPAHLDSRYDSAMSRDERARVDEATHRVEQYTSTTGLNDHPIRYSMGDNVRAHAVDYGKDMTVSGEVNLDRNGALRTTAHEIGHHIEFRNPEVKTRANAFLERRTRGESAERMSKVTGNHYYDDHEITKVDRFSHPYMGKQYSGGTTEIISMGLEQFVADPMGFAKSDPDYFKFMYDVLRSEG